jgi:protein TonB
MYYLAEGEDQHSRFRNAVIMALVAHALVILGVSFDASKAASSPRQIEITLATRPSLSAPQEADRLAQADQVGSGNNDAVTEILSAASAPAMASQRQTQNSQRQDRHTRQDSTALTTTARARHSVAQEEAQKAASELTGISPEVDRLSQELANLEAELSQQTRLLAEQPRVRRLTAASAKQSADAAYLLDWRRRLEAVGNQYYPEASVRYGIYGNVKLMVVIRADGNLEEVKVLSSSGYAVLDEAAIKVVRMAAPYSPFPTELRATTDKLEIIRTWQYLENQLSSAQG